MAKRTFCLAELRAAVKSKRMVSVYYDPDDASICSTGYVLKATEDGVTLEHYTSNGALDGKVSIRMDRVFMVDVDGQYERKMAFLAKHYDDIFAA